ncbi:hypothetical protein H2199_005002 [Coniosporium tulheliwenetii]|uniref:Uncharacterized protein n=1 Tax=Coniosporium tulheliwenetii TaxID=3383036 RepID=A0ACC2Z2M5_9PEZI|nr:hypothetical protein H2199_005002 [Cladosporium sp. JES 115]
MANASQARFNAEAAAWDSNPVTVQSSALAYKSLLEHIPGLNTTNPREDGLDVLEIGCGTGLLSFALHPHVRSLIGVDTAEGMIDVFASKVSSRFPSPGAAAKANITAVNVLLTDPDDFLLQEAAALTRQGRVDRPARFDLVLSHLTLHHIPDMSEILKTMFGCLKPGGRIALTDFEDTGPEAVYFHPEEKREGVERHGIKSEEMERLIKEAGFEEVRVERAFVLEKYVEEEGREKGFLS